MSGVEIISKNPDDTIEVYKNSSGVTRLWVTGGNKQDADIVLDRFSTDDLTLVINSLCGYVLSRTGGLSK